MTKPAHYMLATGKNPMELGENVRYYLKEGYELYGNPGMSQSVTNYGISCTYFQALVKGESKE